jgi:hypothetical protein
MSSDSEVEEIKMVDIKHKLEEKQKEYYIYDIKLDLLL